MRKQIKLAVLSAVAGVAAVSAQAGASYNHDLIVGFTDGSHNDFVFDLGAESALTIGETWSLGGSLGSFNLNTVQWGVIGDKLTTGTAWSTTDGNSVPSTIGSLQVLSPIDSATASIYGNLATAGAGNSAYVSPSFDTSWNVETINPNIDGDYVNLYGNPNITGENTDIFYSIKDNGSSPAVAGYFNLAANGTLTFVPEPSTIGLLTGAGLLMVALRNKFRRNQLT